MSYVVCTVVQAPFWLQVAISTIEWLMMMHTALKLVPGFLINTNSSSNNSSSSSSSNGSSTAASMPMAAILYHCLASFVFVLVLPSIGVLRLERSHRARYNALLELQQQKQQEQQQQQRRSKQQRRQMGDSSSSLAAAAAATGSSIRSSGSFSRTNTTRSSSMRFSIDSDSSSRSAAAAAAADYAFSTSSSCGVQLLRDIASSLQLAANATAAAAASLPQLQLDPPGTVANQTATAAAADPAGESFYSTSNRLVTTAAEALGPLESLLAAASSSSSGSTAAAAAAAVLPDILPGLRGLLGAQEAAAVFAAAAEQAAVHQALNGARRPWSYKSMAGTLPVSIKVRKCSEQECGSKAVGVCLAVACERLICHYTLFCVRMIAVESCCESAAYHLP
jgi:hypothetical protein